MCDIGTTKDLEYDSTRFWQWSFTYGIVYLKIVNKKLMETCTSCSESVPICKLKYGQNLELGQIANFCYLHPEIALPVELS